MCACADDSDSTVQAVQSTQPLTPYPIGNGRVGYFEVRIDSIGTSGYPSLSIPANPLSSLSHTTTTTTRHDTRNLLAHFSWAFSNIGVGLCKKDYPKRKAQPGWRQSSYGWHGDDGRLVPVPPPQPQPPPPFSRVVTKAALSLYLLQYSPTIPIGRAWAGCPIWGPGDIVGCGIDYHTHDIFFTLNGQYLGSFA